MSPSLIVKLQNTQKVEANKKKTENKLETTQKPFRINNLIA